MRWDIKRGITIIYERKLKKGYKIKNPTFKLETVEGEHTEFYVNTSKGDQYLGKIDA